MSIEGILCCGEKHLELCWFQTYFCQSVLLTSLFAHYIFVFNLRQKGKFIFLRTNVVYFDIEMKCSGISDCQSSTVNNEYCYFDLCVSLFRKCIVKYLSVCLAHHVLLMVGLSEHAMRRDQLYPRIKNTTRSRMTKVRKSYL